MVEHSDAYYDYKRNDPDRENPFTDSRIGQEQKELCLDWLVK